MGKDTDDDDGDDAMPEAIALEIGDELDLHHFRPAEVAELVADYLDEVAQRGFAEVRIVHGKGRGTLRRVVHGVLDRSPHVASYAAAERGGWGATVVRLRTPPPGAGAKEG